jgi:transaldolase
MQQAILLTKPILPHLTGCMHIQADPRLSYNTDAIVRHAHRIHKLFVALGIHFPTTRLCIKIPATWEGLAACKLLEASGMKTLATTLFTAEQAIVAMKDSDCSYIAPYINELRVHFEAGYQDPAPNLQLCVDFQDFYWRHSPRGKLNIKTEVLPASLTSIAECMALKGIAHITISPPLLRELAATEYVANQYPPLASRGHRLPVWDVYEDRAEPMTEAEFRLGMTRTDNGRQELKLIQVSHVLSIILTSR